MKKILLLFFLISTFAYCDQWFDSIEINNIELTKLLLKNGADINAKDENGDTALALAIKNNLSATAGFLIKNGADLKSEDINNNYLTLALENSNFEIAELLIDNGIKIIYYNNFDKNEVDNNSPLSIILDKYYSDDADTSLKPSFLSLLNKILNLDINNSSYIYTNIILNRIIYCHDKDTLTLLIENCTDIKTKDKYGNNIFINLLSSYDFSADGKSYVLTEEVNPNNILFEIAELLIKKGVDINTKNNIGDTPLSIACKKLNYKFIEFFIDNKADINTKNNIGETPLLILSAKKFLTKNEFDNNKKDVNDNENNEDNETVNDIEDNEDNETVNDIENNEDNKTVNDIECNTVIVDTKEIKAKRRDKLNHIIETLFLQKGVDVNTLDNNNNSAFLLAKQNSNYPLINLLIQYKSVINNVELEDNLTILQYAASNNNIELFNTVIDDIESVDLKDSFGKTALFYACINNSVDVAQLLINNKADVNIYNSVFESPLMAAAQYNSVDVAKLLINNKANVNLECPIGYSPGNSPLVVAAQYNSIDVAQLLIDNNADINLVTERYGTTPLIEAVSNNNIEMVKLLINNKVKINVSVGKGYTALMSAASNNNIEIAKLLINNKANVNAIDYTEANFATDTGYTSTALTRAIEFNHLEMVKLLINNKANINDKDNIRPTPLMLAVIGDNIEIAKLLINNKAFINVKNDDGWSPLMQSVSNNNIDMARLLISNKANVNVKSENNETALSLAIYQDNTEMIALLKKHGAK